MVKVKEYCSSHTCCLLLEDLQQHVPAVRSVVWGDNVVPAASAFDFCFIVEFDTLDDLAAYDRSDYHQRIRQEIQTIRTVSHSVDFWDAVH